MLACSLSFLAAARGAAQSVLCAVSTTGGVVAADLSFSWTQPADVIASLRAGLESRITFVVRLYEKRPGILPFMGDRMLSERIIARSAFWDFLGERFVVESDSGAQTSYTNANDLLKGFFTVSGLSLYTLPPADLRPRYVTARAQFEPVRLMPPLTLVSLVGAAAASTTPWVRRNAP